MMKLQLPWIAPPASAIGRPAHHGDREADLGMSADHGEQVRSHAPLLKRTARTPFTFCPEACRLVCAHLGHTAALKFLPKAAMRSAPP
jgi:hypothetical protein